MRRDLADRRAIPGEAEGGRFVDPPERRLEAFALRDGAWTRVAARIEGAEARALRGGLSARRPVIGMISMARQRVAADG